MRPLAAALVLAMAPAGAPCWAQVTTTYAYDVQGQVTGVARGGASVAYSYDQAGNRVLVTAAPAAAPSPMAVSGMVQGASHAIQSGAEPAPAPTYPPAFVPQVPSPGPAQPANLGPLIVNGVAVAPAPAAAPRDPGPR